MTDGYWYHGNGKIGGEFHPTKPNDEEHYDEYVKVKHGRWEHYLDEGLKWKCSRCGSRFATSWHYCPNCGAKMESEVEAEE